MWGLCSSSVLVNTVATKLWEQASLREMYYKPKYIVGSQTALKKNPTYS